MNKAVQQQKDLIFALADRVHARAEEHRERGGSTLEADRSVLTKARLCGWKPMLERTSHKAVG